MPGDEELDEYDEYDLPPGFEDIVFADPAPAPPASQETASTHSPVPVPPPPADDDEYDDYYDFSGFTAEDFARIDAVVATAAPEPPDAVPDAGGVLDGGPRVAIELEGAAADASLVVKELAPETAVVPGASPYQRFRSKRQQLSVSDLVGPAWYV